MLREKGKLTMEIRKKSCGVAVGRTYESQLFDVCICEDKRKILSRLRF
jgi:hypothetical protein